MEKRLQDASDIELKAVAYDTLAQIQLLQQQLNAINGELSRRVQEAQQPVQEQVLQSLQPTPSTLIPRTESAPVVGDVQTV